MGSFCASKPATQTTTQSYTADPRVAAAGEQTLDLAQQFASQPFSMPAAPVAGFTPFQTQAFDQTQAIQGGLSPYYGQASAQMARAQAPVTQNETASYMNPYADQALAAMKKYVFDPQRRDTMGSAVRTAGGIGAERLALTSQNLDKTQADAVGQAQAGFYGQAMNQAQRAKEMALQSASGWANLGQGYQSGQLQATGALAGMGAQQQAQSQRELMSPYELALAEIAYPGQQASFLSGITNNMSNVFKGTQTGTTTTQAAQPSMFNQIAGLGMAGAGLMMGNPMMAMGGIGGFMGGGSNPYDRSNPNNNYAAFGPTYFSNRGGAVYENGGAVNPWDIGDGYESGGDVLELSPDEYNHIDAAAPPLESTVNDRFGEMAPSYPPSQTPFNVNDATPMIGAYKTMPPPAIPGSPEISAQRRDTPALPPPSRSPYAPVNTDMGLDRMPREQMPYPDSTERDWGQKLTRSPWMGLVQAGLKMAQSTKSGASGLAEGLESGVKHLGEQRKELRSEEQINQRAEQLYQHAQAELNKYTKKTPHQLATEQESIRYHNMVSGSAQERIKAMIEKGNIVYAGPVKDQPGMSYFYDKTRMGADGKPAIYIAEFNPGEKPGTAVRSPKLAAYERYLKDFPEDPNGAQAILRGHKTMAEADVRKRVELRVTNAMKAQSIQPGTMRWLKEFNERVDAEMAKAKQDYGI